MTLRSACCLGLMLMGCDDNGGSDAGPSGTDAGPSGTDSGMVDTDAGPGGTDAGPGTDAGGGVDAGDVDAGDVDAGGSTGSGVCAATDLVIEEIDPGTSITVFNPTAAPISTAGYVFCQRPTYPSLSSIEAGVTIAANDRHVFAWPSGFADTDAGGEVAFYSSGAFGDAAAQIDFVCWGSGHTPSRKMTAEADGDWVGDCAGAISGGSIRRMQDADGHGPGSYDPTGAAAALSCP
ncbi:MAG: hypothetical protein H6719_28300 [Sandaracinaceae bacterium]|nr:hypothetical protein [Sandaracinaceae bacterium]